MYASEDGWDGEKPWEVWPLPAAPLGLYLTTLSSLVRRGLIPLLIAYFGISLIGIVVQTPTWAQQIMNAYALSNPGQADWLVVASGVIGFIALPISILYGIFMTPIAISMQRIARLSVLAPHTIPTTGSALKQLGRRYWPTLGFMLLTALLVIAGLCLFILPGLAVAILLLAGTYLVVNGTPLTEGFMASVKLVAANWLLVLIYLIVVVVLALLWVGAATGLTVFAINLIGPWGGVATTMLTTLIGFLFGIPGFFLGAALLITMEAGSYGIDVIPDHEMEEPLA